MKTTKSNKGLEKMTKEEEIGRERKFVIVALH